MTFEEYEAFEAEYEAAMANITEENTMPEPEYPDELPRIEPRFINWEVMGMSAEELAKMIRESDTWDNDVCAALCAEAGLEDEWNEADGESFERVVEKAADILGVEIY